ncbi:MAG: hypothetical protein ACOY5G_10970 [Pseudomonadota bacterium]
MGVESENAPQRGQFLPDSPPHSGAMGQEAGEKWAAATHSQPTIPKSDRLLAACRVFESPATMASQMHTQVMRYPRRCMFLEAYGVLSGFGPCGARPFMPERGLLPVGRTF